MGKVKDLSQYDDLLSQHYFKADSPYGFSSKKNLLKVAKKLNKNVKKSHIDHFFAAKIIPGRFRTAIQKFKRRPFITNSANHTWGIDLADMQKYWPQHNFNFRYLLVVTDIFSRYIIALVPLKKKTAVATTAAFEELFKTLPKPKKIISDRGNIIYFSLNLLCFSRNSDLSGGEFYSSTHELFTNLGIKHYYTSDSTQKVAPTERAILTIKQKIFKIMFHQKSKRWVDKLGDVQKSINTSVNRTLGMTPAEAQLKRNEYTVFRRTVNIPSAKVMSKQRPPKYNVGDIVRISMSNGSAMKKSYMGLNFSQILYKIIKRQSLNGIWIYHLKELLSDEPLKGSFYEQELEKVTIDLTKMPAEPILYDHARVNDMLTEIYTKLPGENRAKWIAVEDLYPYIENSSSRTVNQ